MTGVFIDIHNQIINDNMNLDMKAKGYTPLYSADSKSKIVIIGQAPGIRAQETLQPWNDASGETLRNWLGITSEEFYDTNVIALLPMDFYYPGKGVHGDLPPRKGFAEKWHPVLLKNMPDVQLIVLIGQYSQKYYLGKSSKHNLTETVRAHREYLPKYFPLVHPNPLNFRWQAKNPWFQTDVLPELKRTIKMILSS